MTGVDPRARCHRHLPRHVGSYVVAAGCGALCLGLLSPLGARSPTGAASTTFAVPSAARRRPMSAASGASAPPRGTASSGREASAAVAVSAAALGSIAAFECSVAAASGGSQRRRATRRGSRVLCNAAASGSDGVEDEAGAEEKSRRTRRVPEEEGILEKLSSFQWEKLTPEQKEDTQTFFVSLSVALLVRFFLVEPRFIPSLSMYPTFDIGDQLTVDKISKQWRDYQRRDVIVFNPPPAFLEETGKDRAGEALIKRIVALEGDTVEVKDGRLYVNGEAQDEPFINQKPFYTLPQRTVPPGCVFVLGDNRNQSLDGHVWGFLPKENIIGRATLKFWPPWKVGGVTASPP